MAVFGYAIAPKCEPCSTPLGGPFVNCQLELSLPHHKIIFVHSKKPSQPIAMSNLFLPQLYMTRFYFYLNVYFFFYSYFLSNLYSYFLFFTFYLLNKFLLLLPSPPATWLSFTSGWSPASQAPHLGETKKINTKPKQTKWLIFFCIFGHW